MKFDPQAFTKIFQGQHSGKLKRALEEILREGWSDIAVQTSIHAGSQSHHFEYPFFSHALYEAYNTWVVQDRMGPKSFKCVGMVVSALKDHVGFHDAFFKLSGREDATPYLQVLMQSQQNYDLDDALVNSCRNRCLNNALYLIEQGADPSVLDQHAVLIALRYGDVDFANGFSQNVDCTQFSKEIMEHMRYNHDVPQEMIARFYRFEDEHQYHQMIQSLPEDKKGTNNTSIRTIHPYLEALYQSDLIKRNVSSDNQRPTRKPHRL